MSALTIRFATFCSTKLITMSYCFYTGSGKTLAYLWPMIVHILAQPQMKLGKTQKRVFSIKIYFVFKYQYKKYPIGA